LLYLLILIINFRHELKAAEYIEKLPKGCHSVKGLGSTEPDPACVRELPNGTKGKLSSLPSFFNRFLVPCGKGVPSNADNTSLLYNEYIVYDAAQVNLKYLIDFKFKFKETLPW